jgi:hypothetical protein
MSIGMSTVRQARALIGDVQDGHLLDHRARLAAWARADPTVVADLLVVLASMATEDGALSRLIQVSGLSVDVRAEIAREAHRLYARGSRTEWVLRGERIYQRDKKRRYRDQKALRGEAAEVA